jgi:hypothetical protein
MAQRNAQVFYTYIFTIQRSNGVDMTFNFTCDSDIKAKLKAKSMAKKMNASVKPKYSKELAPYKQQNESDQQILLKMLE